MAPVISFSRGGPGTVGGWQVQGTMYCNSGPSRARLLAPGCKICPPAAVAAAVESQLTAYSGWSRLTMAAAPHLQQ